jgi:hypothetical protein
MKTYFDTAVRENRYYSEDWTFCENWRDLGGKIWVDKRVLLRHTGTYVFDYAAQDQLYKDLHELVMQNQAGGGAPVAAPVHQLSTDTSTPVPEQPKTQVLASSKGKKKK